jgi:hypothetical protein
MNSI